MRVCARACSRAGSSAGAVMGASASTSAQPHERSAVRLRGYIRVRARAHMCGRGPLRMCACVCVRAHVCARALVWARTRVLPRARARTSGPAPTSKHVCRHTCGRGGGHACWRASPAGWSSCLVARGCGEWVGRAHSRGESCLVCTLRETTRERATACSSHLSFRRQLLSDASPCYAQTAHAVGLPAAPLREPKPGASLLLLRRLHAGVQAVWGMPGAVKHLLRLGSRSGPHWCGAVLKLAIRGSW